MIEFKAVKKSFTLIEIMLVIAIIAILAALTVPNIRRQRINANEASAISGLKTIHTALETYKDIYSAFPSGLAVLTTGTSAFIPSILITASYGFPCPPDYNGYKLIYSRTDNYTYNCLASPCTINVTGTRYFRVTKSGIIEVQLYGNWGPLE